MVTRLGMVNANNVHFNGVIKIQLPLGDGDALIYNQSNTVHLTYPVDSVKELFAEGEYKIYRNCRLHAGTLEIDPTPLQFTPNW